MNYTPKPETDRLSFERILRQTKQGAEKGVESVRKNAADDKRYERKQAKNGEAFFVLKAGNGEPLGRSETYSSESAMENGIESVKRNAADAEIVYPE
jgi:uncharacterized protein YegP (UPF0339 family)